VSSWFIVDVESDGPCPGLYSMVSFGAVRLKVEPLCDTFYGATKPLEGAHYQEEALAVSGTTREQHIHYGDPTRVMADFAAWIARVTPKGMKPVFVSDNNAFDWQFINYYFHRFWGKNPFGFSARRIGDLYAGIVGDAKRSNEWKTLRKTKHTHDPVDDALGNAEAILEVVRKFGLRIEGLQ
jgi:hypothetical protein